MFKELIFCGMVRRPLVVLVAFHNSEWRKVEKIFFIFYNNVNFYLVTEKMQHAIDKYKIKMQQLSLNCNK